MSGPAKKPSHLTLLQGNPGHQKLNKNEPQPKATMPRAPSWLSDAARKEWQRLAKELNRVGILTEVDGDLFGAYCEAFAKFVETKELAEEAGYTYEVTNRQGETTIKRHPLVPMSMEYLKVAKSIAGEFGLTPSARTKIEVGSGEGDLAEQLLFGIHKQ